MRLLRQIAFDIVFFGSGAACSLTAAVLNLFDSKYIMRCARAWGISSLWGLRTFCNIPVEITGLEYLPEGGAVIAAQHQSTLDVLIWLSIIPRPCFVFKRELRRIPVFGAMLEPGGMVPIDRSGGGAALRDMVMRVRKATKAGQQLVIFPEGTRAPWGKRGTIRNGIAALAQGLDVPVIPVTTNTGQHWGRESFHKTPGKVYVTLHPPLPKGLPREEVLTRLATLYYGPEA